MRIQVYRDGPPWFDTVVASNVTSYPSSSFTRVVKLVVVILEILGLYDRVLALMAQCGNNPGNACRNLHRLIHAEGKTLEIPVSMVSVMAKVLQGKPAVQTVGWPVLHVSSWVRFVLEKAPMVLLGGHSLDNPQGYQGMLELFWRRFKYFRPDLDIYKEEAFNPCMAIPMGLHGDEGRGKLKRPIMVVGAQPIISHLGAGYTNAKGHIGSENWSFLLGFDSGCVCGMETCF